ncbi:hypothetical protein P7C73_g5533, partial [Tremellales sp. Uapishka_1]
MRFKTTITNVSLLHKIIKSLAALAKLCVIKISPDTIHFIIAANEGQKEGVQVWSQIKNTTVPVRGLQKFLSSHLVAGTSIACICENHCVIAYVYIGEINEAGGVLTFFIPAKNA